MDIIKGNIIYEFLEKLNTKGELVFAELGDIEFDADNDVEILDYIREYDLVRSKKGEFTFDAFVYITENGRNILKFKSWGEYQESINNQVAKISEKENDRQEMQYEIDRLTIKNLKLQNKDLKRKVWFGIIGFIAGAILTNLKDILILLKILPQ